MTHKWYEIWAEENDDIPYLLFLCEDLSKEDKFAIIDPKENNKIIKLFSSYDLAKLWLLEDEFTLVRGRMPIE